MDAAQPTTHKFKTSRRILGITSIRSDYDLLSGVYRVLRGEPSLDIALAVCGAHFSPTFGYTVDVVRADGIPIVAEVECLLDSNSRASRAKTGAILMQSLVDCIAGWRPDLVMFAGDREDALAAAAVCAYMRIPTIHLFGGDHATDGNVDNPVRHAVSKLASAHFVAHPQHRDRLVALGEPGERIFVVGNPALDRFREEPFVVRDEALAAVGMPERMYARDYAVVVHHPILGYEERGRLEISMIIEALKAHNINAVVSAPNADAGSRDILRQLDEYRSDQAVHLYRSLPRTAFVNLLRHCRLIIGNSSLGLLESASIPKPAVNVGRRQVGRHAPPNVVFVGATDAEIRSGVERVLDAAFDEVLLRTANPYGDGHSVPRIVELLKSVDFQPYAAKPEDPLQVSQLSNADEI